MCGELLCLTDYASIVRRIVAVKRLDLGLAEGVRQYLNMYVYIHCKLNTVHTENRWPTRTLARKGKAGLSACHGMDMLHASSTCQKRPMLLWNVLEVLVLGNACLTTAMPGEILALLGHNGAGKWGSNCLTSARNPTDNEEFTGVCSASN